jgi:uncharacterized membrane protein
MAANVEFSIMLMIIMGVILYMFVDKRYKRNVISIRTRNMQEFEIVILVLSVTLIDILQFVFPFFENKFVLNLSEIILIVLFLVVDKWINKRESFLG